MTLVQMQYIVAVSNYGSFAKAAENCFVTQPTLSMQIQKAESELGVLLFDRSKQPVTVTEIGKKIIDQARHVLRESTKINDMIQAESTALKGTFKLGIIPTIAPFLVPHFVKNFVDLYPELELRIEELQTDEIIDMLRKDEIDGGILATPLHLNDITEQPLYYEPFLGYISENHRLFKKKKISAEELDIKDIWLLRDGHCFRDQIVNICHSLVDKTKERDHRLDFEGSTLETLMKLVENDLGMTLIPYLLAIGLKDTKREKFVRDFKNPVPKREISIVYQREFLKRHIIKRLVEVIKESIPSELLEKKNSYVVELRDF